MHISHSLSRAAVCAAVMGLLVPAGTVNAGQPIAVHQNRMARDVVLAEGTLQGQYLSSAGVPVEGAEVVIRQGRTEMARVVTDAKGAFQAEGLKSGPYEILASGNVEIIRAWNAEIAPPTSQRYVTIVHSGAVRGQSGGSGLLMWTALGLGITGTAVGIAAYVEATDNDKVAE